MPPRSLHLGSIPGKILAWGIGYMSHMFMPVYNVDAPVGSRQTNAADDVKLVQSLLAIWAEAVPSFTQGLPRMAVDGIYSDNVGNWIRTFQGTAPGSVARDGKIDPIRGSRGHFQTHIGSHTSTLLVLNYNCMLRNPSGHYRLAERLHLVIRPHLT